MVVTAVRGALGFLTRLPVGTGERAWNAFRTTPAALPLAGYVVGGLLCVPFLPRWLAPDVPPALVALAYVVAVYAVTGVTHLDGLADLGDAAAVHGDRRARHRVLDDAAVGAGGTLAVALAVAALGLVGLALAELPLAAAVGLVVAGEVGAKTGMAVVACLGTASHDGLGAALLREASARSLPAPVAIALPASLLTWPHAAGFATLLGGVAAALAVWTWARRRLGGASGDVFGAANELGRLAGLYAGVVAWTLW